MKEGYQPNKESLDTDNPPKGRILCYEKTVTDRVYHDSWRYCLEIYNQYSCGEISYFPESIQKAWGVGERINQLDEGEMCPICGSGDVKMQSTSEIFEFEGQQKTIDDCDMIVCNTCHERVFTDETSKKIEKILKELKE